MSNEALTSGNTGGSLLQVNNENLDALSERVQTPLYDRDSLKSGIVHMSMGGFHRAHQAVYMDDYLAQNPSNWMITGIGLMPNDDQNCQILEDQDCMYTVLERTADSDKSRIIGSIKEIIHAPSNQQAIFDKLQDPDIKILSLTITEKGYCYNESGELNESNALVQHDLGNPSNPKTALGYMKQALQNRKDADMDGFTIMSCDNLPSNGDLTKDILLTFIGLTDKDLASWTEDNISFPNAMVDRITPVTTDAVIDRLRDGFKIDDKWPVICEDFQQWVLEDNFVAGRPALEEIGVQLVSDVEPYEKMKVRLLNGSHSALSYVSYLMGYRDVDIAMNDPLIKAFVGKYMDEDITPSVPDVPGIDLTDYKATLIRRFSNPGIRDQIQRLAEDGSQKIPNGIIPCIKYQLANGGSTKWIALAFAAWFRYLTAVDEKLEPIEIKDPLAEQLITRAKMTGNDPIHMLGMQNIFDDLAGAAPFVQEVSKALNLINQNGTRKTLEEYLKD